MGGWVWHAGSIFATSEDRAKYASLLLQGAMRLTGEALAAALDALKRGDQVGSRGRPHSQANTDLHA